MNKLGASPESIAVLSFAALFALFAALLGNVWMTNLPSMLRDVSWLGIVVIGQAIVIINGEFDLSVGSVFAFVGLVFVLLLNLGFGDVSAFAIAMAVALSIGFVTGVVTWFFKLPSLLVTLGFLFVYRGFVQFFTSGFAVSIPDAVRSDVLVSFFGGASFGIQNSVYICAVLIVIATFVLTRTRFGSHVHAVGGDIWSAIACGVLPGRVKIWTFMISAALAGLGGIVAACALSSVSPTTADGMEFEAVAAAVIGGCSLRGGIGSAWGAVLGVATLMALKAGLILMGTNIFIYQLLLGAVLVSLIAIKGIFPTFFAVR
ncbi:ABC transporter permease [Rhizobium jaguaris]|uniref:ABC transporter permease n=1 Tax=Rhizobium jaguaris TaxID=1312183 RepID=A0A387FJB3_9HYPH|nr:ABC transporter permease [Rhizobium jaguaris]AYG57547.1 ABC transporter permease [Rhizobium jaguaris]